MRTSFNTNQLEPNDNLGRNVCKFCAEKIYNFFEFRSTFLESQKKLQEYFEQYGKDELDDKPDEVAQPERTVEHPSDEPTVFHCDSCPKSFNRSIELRLHKHIHVPVSNGFDDSIDIKTEPYDDEYDDYDATNESDTLNDTTASINNNGEEMRWRCNTCGMSFLRRAHLRQHRRMHPIKREKTMMPVIGKLPTKKSLQSTPKPKPIILSNSTMDSNGFDSPGFDSPGGNSSFDDARWKCKKCPGIFRTRRLLRDHNGTHRSSLPTSAIVAAAMAAVAPPSPIAAPSTPTHVQHEPIMPNTDPTEFRWKCLKCRKAYPTRKLLQKHRLTHRFEIKLHLKTKPSSLKLPMKRDRTERDWLCNICGVMFKRRSMLRDHRRYEHAIQGVNASLLLEPDVEIKTEGLPMIEYPN